MPAPRRALDLLRNSRLLSYAGWGHTAYGRSECVTAHIDAYLVDGTLPPAGTVCPANPNPFITAGLRTADGDGTVDRAASRAAVAPVAASLQSIGLDIVRRCVSVVDIC